MDLIELIKDGIIFIIYYITTVGIVFSIIAISIFVYYRFFSKTEKIRN